MGNRLNLDFSLETVDQRKKFLDEYVQIEQFQRRPPTNDELEMMGNYLLWGRDPLTGKNTVQEKLVQIDTKNGTWDSTSENVESLDALLESPTFNENSVHPLEGPKLRKPKETFDRAKALEQCPESLKPTLRALYRQIYELELGINYYDLVHGKRKNPPRAELLRHFTEEERAAIEAQASHWNQFNYLKKRHLLVELCREQYTIRDTFQPNIIQHSNQIIDRAPRTLHFDAEIPVWPLGLKQDSYFGQLLFKPADQMNPAFFTEDELKRISQFLWGEKREKPQDPNILVFDFANLEHVYELFQQLEDVEFNAADEPVDSTLRAMLDTLNYYVELTQLDEVQSTILDFKIKKMKNQDIADYVNKTYGKSYTANYISTIFRQKIIVKINETAAFHRKVVENLFFEEEFKVCTGCGRVLLRDAENFVRKSRSKDGFSSKCKKCEKKDRDRRNQK